MAFIEPMHRNKPNITYLLTYALGSDEPWTFPLLSLKTYKPLVFNSSPPEQDGCHFADNIFRCIFMSEIFFILVKILLKFIPKVLINNNPLLV